MEITCPEHGGIIYVPGNDSISAAVKTLIIACPVCDEEVLINDVYHSDGKE